MAAPPSSGAPAATRGRRRFGVCLNQIVASQAALVLVLVGLLLGGAALVAAAGCAACLLAVTWVRARGRWAFGWLGTLMRFALRRRAARIEGSAAALRFAAPRTVVTTAELAGAPAAVIADELGLIMVFEIGGRSAEIPPLPPLATLLPAPDRNQPSARMQLVLSGAPASAGRSGPATSSYRALCEGATLGQHSATLAVRVLRTGGWTDDELRRELLGLGRRLIRRLAKASARPLDAAAAIHAIADLAHAGEPTQARESWSGLWLGGLIQATFQCHPRAGDPLPAHLPSRLLHLPAVATTVAVTSDLHTGQANSLLVRLAAVDTTGLSTAVQALHRLLAAESVEVQRWDGAHLPGLAATIPLAGWSDAEGSFDSPDLPAVPAGLMLGRNRQGNPVQARLFRPERTLVLLAGGLPAAQLLVFRALATGARVIVQSTRPQAWEPFVRGAAAPGESITVMPPNRLLDIPAGSPLHPTLTVVDTSRPGPASPNTGPATTLTATDGRGRPAGTTGPATTLTATDGHGRPAGTTGPATTLTAADGRGRLSGAGTSASHARGAGTKLAHAHGVDADIAHAHGVGADTTHTHGFGTDTAHAHGERRQKAGKRRETSGERWQTTLVVRETIEAADVETATAADLLVLQVLGSAEAALLGGALRLGEAADYLTRMRPDMIAVVSKQRVRWATLAQTQIEAGLIGDPARTVAGF
ncbi:type VII secretion protein EccE [Actinoplanes sp. NPDC024001]|uniref:type VII secretion protein EccE n=1 Tax=Actinoplanes sp. NPDC024001 TaxID=3154598 RepID=UPI0033CB322C